MCTMLQTMCIYVAAITASKICHNVQHPPLQPLYYQVSMSPSFYPTYSLTNLTRTQALSSNITLVAGTVRITSITVKPNYIRS